MRKKLLTLFATTFLLFSFTVVFGQSVNNLIDQNATFKGNTNAQESFTDPEAYYQTIATDDIAGGTLTIAEVIEDLDGDLIPDRLGQTVTVQGVVFSPNFQATNNSFYIHDGTAGTDIFMYGPPVFTWAMGDELEITGEVAQYNGMTEIIPADEFGWVFVTAGNPTPDPIVITITQYNTDPEAYEGSLVGFMSLDKVAGQTWPASGSSANLDFTDGIDIVTFRIDSDTDIDDNPEPDWPKDIIGIGSQYDSDPPYDGGYQIFPRFYATDFLDPGTLPVELTSFTVNVNNNGNVILNWSTATELNNQMFEIERKSEEGQYITIGYVNGRGTTTEPQEYSYIDNTVESGIFFYRLKQIDFGGRYEYSDAVEVDVKGPLAFGLDQNYPNPFNPSTIIKYRISETGSVRLSIYNTLGEEVAVLVNGLVQSGFYEITFYASNLPSGVYFSRLKSGNKVEAKKMILTK